MEEGRSSLTAVIAAMMRAAHLLVDGEPKILVDDLALGLSNAENEATLRANLNTLQTEVASRSTPALAQVLLRRLRAFVTVRSRYVEDELETALQRGVRQYVILGAGLDSFAYRRRALSGSLHVFEVDHPASQQGKRTRLHELNVTIPHNLTFIPIDFEKQTLVEALRAGGYRLEEPGFFSWLGVTEFLTAEAVFRTLREVASLTPGSEIIFEYAIPEEGLAEEDQRLAAVLKAGGAARGEPWLSQFDPASLTARLKELGFVQVVNFGPEEATARYFAGRTDGLCVPKLGHLMRARVGVTHREG